MLRTRAPLSPKASFDLHVLGMPPAFVLSQDQTLKLMSENRPANRSKPGQGASYLHNVTNVTSTSHIRRRGADEVCGTLRHIDSLVSRLPALVAGDVAPPPTCPFIQPTMRKSETTSPPLLRSGKNRTGFPVRPGARPAGLSSATGAAYKPGPVCPSIAFLQFRVSRPTRSCPTFRHKCVRPSCEALKRLRCLESDAREPQGARSVGPTQMAITGASCKAEIAPSIVAFSLPGPRAPSR